ncbi:MAG: imidazole glycerol phosphate synthase subunit HisF [Candidatus Scalindua rubra]|uniref:imidazole glycerol-phosphate synthase n=1 Tax=Candidatus Scalindua rubra TaxID=1872076 RepID=A0A1E3XDN0_9BACT|nr:MAG: imidazole glycerol phosphate synthase subunit HisF [Candidatus Scalindua rubra]
MLKKRLLASLIVSNGIVVQSIGFKKYLPVGRPHIAVEYLNYWGIDEIVLLDINATLEKREPDYDCILECAKYCFVPLTVGGGIRTVNQIRNVLSAGADKVSINSVFLENPDFISEAAAIFGEQCIVVSIDVYGGSVYSYKDKKTLNQSPVIFARKAEQCGAGEIFLNSVDRDGSKMGYDLDLIHIVTESVNIPVVACGGAGHPAHFHKALLVENLSGVAAGNYFHFTEHSVIVTKAYLESQKVSTRLNTYADYRDNNIDVNGRRTRKSDEVLQSLRFKDYPQEVI